MAPKNVGINSTFEQQRQVINQIAVDVDNLSNAGYLTSANLVGYATETYVNTAIVGFITTGASGSSLTGIVTSITAGSGISIDQSTGNVTITSTSEESTWVSTAAGIHTLSNVGIGTTNPTSKLDVYGNITISGDGFLYDSTDPNYNFRPTNWQLKGGGYITESNTVNGYIQIGEKYIYGLDDVTGGDFEIKTNGHSYFRGGNLGVGTNNPTSKLDVNGTLNVSGVSTFKDNVYISDSLNDGRGWLRIGDLNQGYPTVTLGGTYDNTNLNPGWVDAWYLRARQTLYVENSLQLGNDTGTTGSIIYNNSFGRPEWNSSVYISPTTSNVGIGTTNTTEKLTVRGGDISVGVSTAHGVILTSENGTRYRLIVGNDGTISSVAV